MLKVSIYLWLMLISMQSYYFYDIGIAIPPFIAAVFSGLFIVFLLLFREKRLRYLLFDGWRAFAFIFILVSLSVFDVMFLGADFLAPRFFAVFMYLGVVLHFLYLQNYNLHMLRGALKACVVTHLLFFWVQVLSYYLGFGLLDFIEPVTGETQRVFGGGYSIDFLGGGFIRGAGLYNEPGTFATFLFVMYLLYKAVCRDASHSLKFEGFDFFVIFSTALSFSIFGLVFVSIYVSLIFIILWRRLLVYSPLFIFIGVIIFESYVYPRFFSAAGGNYDSGFGFRGEGLGIYVDKVLEFPYLLFGGVGFFSDIDLYFGSDIVWNDLGLAFYFIVAVGLVGGSAFLAIFLFGYGQLRFYDFLLLIIVLISKISPAMMVFWLCVAVLYGGKAVARYEER